MSKTIQPGRIRASMSMLAAALGAVAPVATVAPVSGGPGSPTIQAPAGNQQAQPSMAQQQTVRVTNSQAVVDGGDWSYGPNTNIHTFPAWNQRKARRKTRQTGRKIQKRYQR